MRNRLAFIALAAAAGLAQAAYAQEAFPVVVKAYESELESMRLPGSTGGTLSFRPCSECEYKTVRVSAGTHYEADGQTYGLEDFRQAVETLARGQTSVTIKHHLESDLITSIRVTSY